MKGKNVVVTAAVLVLALRMWQQVRGTTKTPFSEWAIGYGALFFMLGLLAEVSAPLAGSVSVVVAGADFLQNGLSLTTDITSLIGGKAQPGQSGFVAQPFAQTGATKK